MIFLLITTFNQMLTYVCCNVSSNHRLCLSKPFWTIQNNNYFRMMKEIIVEIQISIWFGWGDYCEIDGVGFFLSSSCVLCVHIGNWGWFQKNFRFRSSHFSYRNTFTSFYQSKCVHFSWTEIWLRNRKSAFSCISSLSLTRTHFDCLLSVNIIISLIFHDL